MAQERNLIKNFKKSDIFTWMELNVILMTRYTKTV